MEPKRSNSAARDFILFIILTVLVVNAYKDGYTFLALHNNSIIHELDRSFTDQLYTVQRQLRVTKTIVDGRPENKEQENKEQENKDSIN